MTLPSWAAAVDEDLLGGGRMAHRCICVVDEDVRVTTKGYLSLAIAQSCPSALQQACAAGRNFSVDKQVSQTR